MMNKANKVEVDAAASTKALLRSLKFGGVKFLRYVTVDACGNIRAKARPLDSLLKATTSPPPYCLDNQISIATVCFAGLPCYSDTMIAEETGIDAKDVLKICPDLNSLRILPYSPTTAMVTGFALNQYTNEPSQYCSKSILQRVIHVAAEKYNTSFSIGAEIEFCLVDAKTEVPVDFSVFANSTTLNDQDTFLEDLYDQLHHQQYIPVECIHAESAPGQVEVVLEYSNDPMEMADNIIYARETIRAVAKRHGLKAHFTPKYSSMAAGNGMHIHVSTRNHENNQPDFCQGSSLTPKGASFVEGVLRHLPGLLGLTVPTVNSFQRIGRGCWTGSVVGWDVEDKECGVRVCSNISTQEWDHVELKLVDHTPNIYLAMAGLLQAGIHGIAKECILRPSLTKAKSESDKDIMSIEPLPATALEALNALQGDESLTTMLGPKMTQAYLALRRHEAVRANKMTMEEQVQEFMQRA